MRGLQFSNSIFLIAVELHAVNVHNFSSNSSNHLLSFTESVDKLWLYYKEFIQEILSNLMISTINVQ